MKFYFRGVVWDPSANKALCRSENGEFETEDDHIINELKRLGYPNEGKVEPVNKGVKAIDINTNKPAELRKESPEEKAIKIPEEKTIEIPTPKKKLKGRKGKKEK